MNRPRREFLWFAGAASSLALGRAALGRQGKHKFPEPPPPAEKDDPNAPSGDAQAQSGQLAQLKLNEKEFRESLASLYQRVGELKQDLETVQTSQVFSMKVYKQTGEIEHLAKKLRTLAKI
jgi:hypothetical protein